MKNLLAASILLLFCCAAHCDDEKKNALSETVAKALANADEFTLYSLDPDERNAKGAKDVFHDFRILGSAVIKDKAEQKKVVDALQKGVADSNGAGAKCFDPRHGIRVKQKDKTIDVVICFACKHVYVYIGETREFAVTTGSPEAAFDKALTDAKVPLAPKTH